MSDSKSELCDKCGTRPASIHLCESGTGESRNLCEDCLAQEDPLAIAWMSEAKNAKCEYCGGWPCGRGMDTFGQITGATAAGWMCFPCSMEHHSYTLAAINKIPKGLAGDEQMEILKRIAEETKSHMQQFVAMRSN